MRGRHSDFIERVRETYVTASVLIVDVSCVSLTDCYRISYQQSMPKRDLKEQEALKLTASSPPKPM
jgi:hypothetical protein